MLSLIIDYSQYVLSLTNATLLLWLGLTVVLNAERRNIGVWLVGGSLLLGSAFFISYLALRIIGINTFTATNTLFLAVASLPPVVLPFAWYGVILWYAGYFNQSAERFRRRHKGRLTLLIVLLIAGVIALTLLGMPYVPVIGRITAPIWQPLRWIVRLEAFGVPIVMIVYPIYTLFCIVSSLDALWRPAQSERLMGDEAQRRARPWLAATAFALLAVGIVVTSAMVWIFTTLKVGNLYILTNAAFETLSTFDLMAQASIMVGVLCVGQAIVSYELFTGHSLPRRGLLTFWRWTVLFAVGLSLVISVPIVRDSPLIFSVLLTIILLATGLALLSWQSYVERENGMARLRPFVRSEGLYQSLLADDWSYDPFKSAESHPSFQALCKNVLHCERAFLVATGAFAPLVDDLTFGEGSAPDIAPLLGVSAETFYTVIDPDQFNDAHFAIPLWSERGLIGIFLLGKKADDGLYTQEEIEIARTTCERLIDTQASAAVSRRLMQLQRERMAQNLVIDQQSRRVLHDEVLPLIQTAMIALSGNDQTEAMSLLGNAHKEVSNLLHELPMVATPDVKRLGVIGALRRVMEIEFATAFDAVIWEIDEVAEAQLREVGEISAETLYYAAREIIRNAAKYARHPKRALHLTFKLEQAANEPQGRGQRHLRLTIYDNGVGERSSTTASTGQGLTMHSTLMAVVGGSLAVESVANEMTRVILTLPC